MKFGPNYLKARSGSKSKVFGLCEHQCLKFAAFALFHYFSLLEICVYFDGNCIMLRTFCFIILSHILSWRWIEVGDPSLASSSDPSDSALGFDSG